MDSLPKSSAQADSIGRDPHSIDEGPDHPRTGRRSFLGRGAAVVAAGAAFAAGRRAEAANPNYLPSLYPRQNVLEFKQIQLDENNHVEYLLDALGSNARPMPTFQNLDTPNLLGFAQVAMALENTGTGAYLGAAPYIQSPQVLIAAARILPIEARHASYLDVLLNKNLLFNALGEVPEDSLETPLTQQQVIERAGPFIADLNGGPPLGFSTTPSPENDIAILNFALALEYLEAAYYNLNVPKYT